MVELEHDIWKVENIANELLLFSFWVFAIFRIKYYLDKIVLFKIALLSASHLMDLVKDVFLVVYVAITQNGLTNLMQQSMPYIRWVISTFRKLTWYVPISNVFSWILDFLLLGNLHCCPIAVEQSPLPSERFECST